EAGFCAVAVPRAAGAAPGRAGAVGRGAAPRPGIAAGGFAPAPRAPEAAIPGVAGVPGALTVGFAPDLPGAGLPLAGVGLLGAVPEPAAAALRGSSPGGARVTSSSLIPAGAAGGAGSLVARRVNSSKRPYWPLALGGFAAPPLPEECDASHALSAPATS